VYLDAIQDLLNQVAQEKQIAVTDCANKFKSVEAQFAAVTIKIIDRGNANAKFIDEQNFWQVRVLLTQVPNEIQ
jgi:hypothetical protein